MDDHRLAPPVTPLTPNEEHQAREAFDAWYAPRRPPAGASIDKRRYVGERMRLYGGGWSIWLAAVAWRASRERHLLDLLRDEHVERLRLVAMDVEHRRDVQARRYIRPACRVCVALGEAEA